MGYGQHSGHCFDRGEGSTKKRLAGYEECVRAWLSGSQDDGRASGGRMYFDRATIYSYGSHYPMAHITKGRQVCLRNSDSSSVTTNKHMWLVRKLIGEAHFQAVFCLPTSVMKMWARLDRPGERLSVHAAAFDHFRSLAKEHFSDSLSNRRREPARDSCARMALAMLEEANRYADVFGLERPYSATNCPEAARFAFALGDASALVAYHVKEMR